MQLLKKYAFIFLFITNITQLFAQEQVMNYSLTKGQVFDIILLSHQPDNKEKMKQYFATVFPIANARSYESLKGFSIKNPHTQGNYQPEVIAFGYWKDLASRHAGVKALETELTDFHEQRRTIWSSFNLTYYELKNDLSFSINREKYNVVTLYWQSDKGDFKKFKQQWTKAAQRAGGKTVVSLTDGESPFGYHFNPDWFSITEWESEASFNEFYKKNLTMNHAGVLHVNQFVLK
ncbi:MAG: hypothetical protein AB8G22_15490 [Saprospiraceae bacterium]